MPITRLHNYLPGSLAKGEDVQDEYDSIIAFINGLETDKLDAVGGTVANLTVSGTLDVNGASDFDGLTTFSGNVTLDTGADLILGVGSDLTVGGDLVVTGTTTLNGILHANGSFFDVDKHTIIKGNGTTVTKLEVKNLNTQSLLKVDKTIAYVGVGTVTVEDSQNGSVVDARVRPQGVFTHNSANDVGYSAGFWLASSASLAVPTLENGFCAWDTTVNDNLAILDADELLMKKASSSNSVMTLDKKKLKFTSTADTRKAWFGDFATLSPLGTEWGLALEAGAGLTSKIELGMIGTDPKITLDKATNKIYVTAFGIEFDSSGTGDWSIIGGIVAGSTVAYFPHLPTVAGASGTLWVDVGAGNVVKRVP